MRLHNLFLSIILIGVPVAVFAEEPVGPPVDPCEVAILDILKYCFPGKPDYDPNSCALANSAAFVYCPQGLHNSLCNGLLSLKDAFCKKPKVEPLCTELTTLYANRCII